MCTTSRSKMIWKLQKLGLWFLWSTCFCWTNPRCSGHTCKIILCVCSVSSVDICSAHCGTVVQHVGAVINTGALYKSIGVYYVTTPIESLTWVEKSYVKFLLETFWLQPQHVKNLLQDNNIWSLLSKVCGLHITSPVSTTSGPSSCTERVSDLNSLVAKGTRQIYTCLPAWIVRSGPSQCIQC